MLKNTAYAFTTRLFIPLLFFLNSFAQNREISTENSPSSKIDSVRKTIRSSGWTSSLCFEYQKYLINSKINFEYELKFLDKLPSGIYTKFIHALLLKKQTRFRDMFDTLSALLENKPRFYSFYNELAFSAAALNQLSSLEAQVNRIYSSPDLNVFKIY
ncbi:MAG TPA: hypothetical protein VLM39_10495, partial [Ignavibacteriaceae bacterium]|nr:hypothetical protein [Ignavibacteriaceae bacterium]